MKKLLSLFLIFLSLFTIVSCDKKDENVNNDNPTNEDLEKPAESKGFIIHYSRNDDDYDPWCLWLWENGKDGAIHQFNGSDSFGAYYKADWELFSKLLENSKLGFIIRKDTDWTKDYDQDRFFQFKDYEYDNNGYYNIYIYSGDKEIYISPEKVVSDNISLCNLTYDTINKIVVLTIRANKEIKEYKIYHGTEVLNDPDNIISSSLKEVKYSLGTSIPDLSKKLSVEVEFKESGKTINKDCDITNIYSSSLFNDLYTYDGELGAIYSQSETTFRVWSPVSSQMKLRIYNTGTPESTNINGKLVNFENGSNEYQEYTMTKGEKGTWQHTITGNLEGKYYTFVVTNAKYKDVEVVDPYAKSTGINGLRGMIVDFSKTNPEGWDNVKLNNKKSNELVVYECHIADLTSSSTWNGTKENQKTFVGFYEEGTKYEDLTTGFDHIKELGVNAVQILPLFDAANDERLETREFNWGYNPLNYNSIDGIYSKNPYDGYEKIKEFKNLVKAYSNVGINIIMDVVYNHVNGLDMSNFDVLMPNYYFRYTMGVASNGSGCGNETASNMPMFQKFMIDSTEFWAKEYKLGGFRFDLMGLHDIETMNLLTKNLHENVDSAITVYGEPWAGGTPAYASNKLAGQSNMDLYEGYGCFNDQMRDALIKGGLSGALEKGWITENTKVTNSLDISKIKSGISGKVLVTNYKHEVDKCVNYVTCHDNYTLYDRIKAAGITDEDTIKKMATLAQSVVLTSQGTKFILSGEEILRTKNGNHNSYNSSYEENELDYSLKAKNKDLFEIYKKLIAMHNDTDLFNKSSDDCKNIVIDVNQTNNLITYKLNDTNNNKEYIIIHCNGYSKDELKANLEGYTLYLDTLSTPNLSLTAETVISSYQTIIAYK